jgi:ATP-dependent exoDNAse (exonuclease V) beta subunit
MVYGVHVMSDRKTFDIDDPLGGRWLHFWPNPYTTSKQGGPVKDAYERSSAHAQVVYRTTREALRVLYVGWTRARDRLVLASRPGELLSGILNTLVDIDPTIISDPNSTEPGTLNLRWAGQDFALAVEPCAPGEARPNPTVTGTVRLGRAITQHPPARLSASSAAPRAFTLGPNVVLGSALKNAATDAAALGSAVHAFLAADRRGDSNAARTEMARLLLSRWHVAEAVQPKSLIEVADRFWGWVHKSYPGAMIRREWPMAMRLPSSTIVQGTADLIIEAGKTVVIVDHKSYATATTAARSEGLGGQLATYADAVSKAKPGHTIETWVHLPLGGLVAQVHLA